MGYEFNIHLRETDLEAIRKDPRGTNPVAKLLQEIPCYKGMSEDGTRFFYGTDEASDSRWQSYIVIRETRLELCSFHEADYRCIVPFLLDRLMDLCGHFEIEDA